MRIGELASVVLMTEAQRKANRGKVHRTKVGTIDVCIEQPRGTRKGPSILSAHYGYIHGTKGADGAQVDCFVGPNSASAWCWVIDHAPKGKFDEHKVMLAFDTESDAADCYAHTYGRRPAVIRKFTPADLMRWLKGDAMQFWNDDTPVGRTLDGVLYDIRREAGGLVFDPIEGNSFGDKVALDGMIALMSRIETSAEILGKAISAGLNGITVSSTSVSEPFVHKGRVLLSIVYGLSDGQTITVFFHNPDSTPMRAKSNDVLVSFRWMLNKADVTKYVSPEKGLDQPIRAFARRIALLAQKNSTSFVRQNAGRSDKVAKLVALRREVEQLEKQLAAKMLQAEEKAVAAEVAPANPTGDDQDIDAWLARVDEEIVLGEDAPKAQSDDADIMAWLNANKQAAEEASQSPQQFVQEWMRTAGFKRDAWSHEAPVSDDQEIGAWLAAQGDVMARGDYTPAGVANGDDDLTQIEGEIRAFNYESEQAEFNDWLNRGAAQELAQAMGASTVKAAFPDLAKYL